MFHLTNQLNAGIQVYNPIGGKMLKSDEQLSAIYKMGLGYDVSEILMVATELVKEENNLLNLNAGVQYQMVKNFFVRIGISSATASSYGGVGICWNNMRLDISGSYHPQLGWSPGLLLLFNSRNTIVSPPFLPK